MASLVESFFIILLTDMLYFYSIFLYLMNKLSRKHGYLCFSNLLKLKASNKKVGWNWEPLLP